MSEATSRPIAAPRHSVPSSSDSVQFAASVKWFHPAHRLNWFGERGLGVQYSPHPGRLENLPADLKSCRDLGLPLRLHAFFPDYEIGEAHQGHAAEAMRIHRHLLEIAATTIDQPVITCHLGLNTETQIDPSRAEDNLGMLIERARVLGVTICIENLRRGFSADPLRLSCLAENTGANITLDIGHALGSQAVATGAFSVHSIIDLFKARLAEVHYYEKETDRHYRPENMQILGPVVDHLLTTPCRWWTIELETEEDIHHTLAITRSYLRNRAQV